MRAIQLAKLKQTCAKYDFNWSSVTFDLFLADTRVKRKSYKPTQQNFDERYFAESIGDESPEQAAIWLIYRRRY